MTSSCVASPGAWLAGGAADAGAAAAAAAGAWKVVISDTGILVVAEADISFAIKTPLAVNVRAGRVPVAPS
jgi:hypothetical protein